MLVAIVVVCHTSLPGIRMNKLAVHITISAFSARDETTFGSAAKLQSSTTAKQLLKQTFLETMRMKFMT